MKPRLHPCVLASLAATCLVSAAEISLSLVPQAPQETGYRVTQTITQSWVNGAWKNSSFTGTAFDLYGSMASIETYTWDTTITNWALAARYRYGYEYNAQGKSIRGALDTWVIASGIWQPMSRWDASYDAAGNWLGGTYESWNATQGAWAYSQKIVAAYDGNNNMSQWLTQQWDTTSGGWVNWMLYQYAYDQAGNRTEWVTHMWVAATWRPSSRSVSAYDAAGNQVQSTQMVWDTVAGTWVNSSSRTYAYDAHGNVTEQVQLRWTTPGNVWTEIQRMRSLNTCDQFGNPVDVITQLWDPTGQVWINHSHTLNTYEAYQGVQRGAVRTRVGGVCVRQLSSDTRLSVSLPSRAAVSLQSYSPLGRLAGRRRQHVSAGAGTVALFPHGRSNRPCGANLFLVRVRTPCGNASAVVRALR